MLPPIAPDRSWMIKLTIATLMALLLVALLLRLSGSVPQTSGGAMGPWSYGRDSRAAGLIMPPRHAIAPPQTGSARDQKGGPICRIS